MSEFITEAEIVALCGFANNKSVRKLIAGKVLNPVGKTGRNTKLYDRQEVLKLIQDYLPNAAVFALGADECSPHEAALLLNIKPSTFDSWVALGKVPVKRRIGLGKNRRRVFDRRLIEALAATPHGLTLREIGLHLGCTHEYVRQLRQKGVIPQVVTSLDEIAHVRLKKGKDHHA